MVGQKHEIVRYAKHHLVDDYLRLGWVPSGIDGGLIGTPHGAYAILIQFICCCGRNPVSPADLIEIRRTTHGNFTDTATYIQSTKELWRSLPGWAKLSDRQKEAMDCIAIKAGRILAGDAGVSDHWDDIAGYAQLGKG